MRIPPVSFELYLAQQLDLDALMLYLFAWSVGDPNLQTTSNLVSDGAQLFQAGLLYESGLASPTTLSLFVYRGSCSVSLPLPFTVAALRGLRSALLNSSCTVAYAPKAKPPNRPFYIAAHPSVLHAELSYSSWTEHMHYHMHTTSLKSKTISYAPVCTMTGLLIAIN